MNLRRVMAIAHKEWREILRDRLFFTLAFLVPLLWMWVFGYGLTLDVENVPFAVLDLDRTDVSRDYLSRFVNSRFFDFKGYVASERDIEGLLADNRIRMALVIPEHFQERLVQGRPASVQTLLDGTFPYRAQTAKGYSIAITQSFSDELVTAHLARTLGTSPEEARRLISPIGLEVRYLYNQEVRSLWFLAPSLIMFVLILSPPLLTALSVVREKETGSIYNVYSSTAGRGEFIAGKLLPNILISCVNAVLLWLMATQLFQAPFKGDFGFLALVTVLYLLCTTGIGLLVSLLVTTQIAALLITVILTIVPTMLYSGMFVPVSSLTAEAQIEAHLFPAMYYNNVVLGVFLKGVGMDRLWPEVAALALYAVVLLTAGWALFRKRPGT